MTSRALEYRGVLYPPHVHAAYSVCTAYTNQAMSQSCSYGYPAYVAAPVYPVHPGIGQHASHQAGAGYASAQEVPAAAQGDSSSLKVPPKKKSKAFQNLMQANLELEKALEQLKGDFARLQKANQDLTEENGRLRSDISSLVGPVQDLVAGAEESNSTAE
jgi:hypothetical protein